jgi:hypothetical protein
MSMRLRIVKGLFLFLLLAWVPRRTCAAGPYEFYSVIPCRLIDTRRAEGPTGGPALQAGAIRGFPIKGLCGIPSTARQVAVNITLMGATENGYLVVWPYKTEKPATSNLNAQAGSWAIANGAILTIANDPKLGISVLYSAASGRTDLIIDVTGYLQ